MKYMKQISALVLAVSLLCTASVPVRAHETPDRSRQGSVTVKMEYEGKAVTGGTMTAYLVGEIQESDGNYSFEKTEAMGAFTGSYEDITAPSLAEDVASFVREHAVPACATAENKEGRAVFFGLELGLYLIVQTEASEGYEPLRPFLVSVPMNEDGRYVYEVDAEGKFQLHQQTKPHKPHKPGEPDSPSTPGNPSEPNSPSEPHAPQGGSGVTLPQTGQLNWPVPVLAALGLCLFSIGWMLRFGKKNGYEK